MADEYYPYEFLPYCGCPACILRAQHEAIKAEYNENLKRDIEKNVERYESIKDDNKEELQRARACRAMEDVLAGNSPSQVQQEYWRKAEQLVFSPAGLANHSEAVVTAKMQEKILDVDAPDNYVPGGSQHLLVALSDSNSTFIEGTEALFDDDDDSEFDIPSELVIEDLRPILQRHHELIAGDVAVLKRSHEKAQAVLKQAWADLCQAEQVLKATLDAIEAFDAAVLDF